MEDDITGYASMGTQTGRFKCGEPNMSSDPKPDESGWWNSPTRVALHKFGALSGEVHFRYEMAPDELLVMARIERGRMRYESEGRLFAQGVDSMISEFTVGKAVMDCIRGAVASHEKRDGG